MCWCSEECRNITLFGHVGFSLSCRSRVNKSFIYLSRVKEGVNKRLIICTNFISIYNRPYLTQRFFFFFQAVYFRAVSKKMNACWGRRVGEHSLFQNALPLLAIFKKCCDTHQGSQKKKFSQSLYTG